MGKRDRFRDDLDPELRRWGRKYRSFPGVDECVRLILAGQARGAWADFVVFELAENAPDHLEELVTAFREHASDIAALYLLEAIEIAALPESVGFFSELLLQQDPRFAPYAQRALAAINTRDARAALYRAQHAGTRDRGGATE
jgi:hypothetical protein